MLKKLIRIANKLDKKGLYDEANLLDKLIKMAASRSPLIKALKNNNKEQAQEALSNFVNSIPYGSSPSKELRMTDKEFSDFAEAIQDGKLEKARQIFSIEMDTELNPITHSPFTGHPWASTLVQQTTQDVFDDLLEILYEINKLIKDYDYSGNFDSVDSIKRKGIHDVFSTIRLRFKDRMSADSFINDLYHRFGFQSSSSGKDIIKKFIAGWVIARSPYGNNIIIDILPFSEQDLEKINRTIDEYF